jgi:hypothetical protein
MVWSLPKELVKTLADFFIKKSAPAGKKKLERLFENRQGNQGIG